MNGLTGRQDNVNASSNCSNRSSPRKSSNPQTSSPMIHPQPLINEDENLETEFVEQPVEEVYSEGVTQSDEDHQMDVEERVASSRPEERSVWQVLMTRTALTITL